MEATFTMGYVPPVFRNCAGEYRGDADDKYLGCEIEPGMDRCELLQELHQAKDFRKYFLAVIPLVLSMFAIILNFIFVFVVCSLMLRNRAGSKKRYAFLASRSISTIIGLVLFYIVLIAWKFGGFNYFSAAIFLFVGTMSFLTLTGTYLAMTSLLYAAVVHPLEYMAKATMMRCLTIIALIWTISVVSSVLMGVFGGTLFYPQTAPIHCEFDNCQLPLAFALVIVLMTSYLAVILCYVGMVLRMHWRCRGSSRVSPFMSNTIGSQKQQHLTSIHNTAQERNIRAMNRLAWNLITFTISKSPLLAVSIVALINLAELRTLGLGHKSPCKTYLKGRLFFQAELLASLAAIVWLLGMLMDPIINMLTDPTIYARLRRAFRRVHFLLGKISRRQMADTLEAANADDSAEF